jgi:hypothetical protein
MTVALPLSMQVNNQHLPNLNSSSTDQVVAAEINKVDILINDSSIGIKIPALNGSSVKPFSLLATPFDAFLSASAAVNQTDSGSACNFLAATFILAADVTVIAVGTLTITAGVALLTVAGQYCDSSCFLTFVNSVGSFLSAEGNTAAADAWNGAYSIYCAIPGRCPATTSTTAPEFPSQYLGLLFFIGIATTAFLASGRGLGAQEASPSHSWPYEQHPQEV